MVGKYYFTRIEMETTGCTCRCVLPVHPLRSLPICRANLIASGFGKTLYRSLPPLTYRWSCIFLSRSSQLLTRRKPVTSTFFFYPPAQHDSVSADVCLRTNPALMRVSLCMLLFCTSIMLDTGSNLPCCVRAPLSR